MPRAPRQLVVRLRVLAVLGCLSTLAACGSGGKAAPASSATSVRPAASAPAGAPVPEGDWTRFDYDAARSGVDPASTGITSQNVSDLQRRHVRLDGTVDSSPIELHGITIGGQPRDVVILTTTYGRTIAIDAATGHKLWEFVPPDIHSYQGSYRITTATPIADPSRRYVFAASPDGVIRKLSVFTGHEVRSAHWPAHVTTDPRHEKIASALNISGGELIVVTGGYIGDIPPYQGHVVTIDRSSGRLLHVWNSLCANVHRLLVTSRCPLSDSAIWGRAGAVVEPGSGRLLVATGNADTSETRPFDGHLYWSDSVLELTANASELLHNWTPRNQVNLSTTDTDLGSTSPALLPPIGGQRLAVQGGKDGTLRLLNLARLNGTAGRASSRLGGELQDIAAPGSDQVLTAPVAWSQAGRDYVFVADDSGTAEYVLQSGAQPRLHRVAEIDAAGTSPTLAGGLLYVFDEQAGVLKVYDPLGLRPLATLPAATGHWNSPIAIGGRVILPEGNANDHATRGALDIYHLPGR